MVLCYSGCWGRLTVNTQEVRLVFTKRRGLGELTVYVGSDKAPNEETATSVFGPAEVSTIVLKKVFKHSLHLYVDMALMFDGNRESTMLQPTPRKASRSRCTLMTAMVRQTAN